MDELFGNDWKYYKNYTKSELKEIIKNLPLDKLLDKLELSNYQYFALFDEGHMKALDEYYNIDNLPIMKEILKVLVLENVASLYTSSDYANLFTECYSSLSGEKITFEQLNIYIEDFKIKPKMMGSYLNRKYDEKYFTEIEKQEIIELINKIKEHYSEVIKNFKLVK